VDVDQGTVTDAALFALNTDDPAPPGVPIGFKQIEVVFGSEWNHVGVQGTATDPTDFYYDLVVETGAPGPAGFKSLITGKTGATRELASDLYKQQTEQVDALKNNVVPPKDLAGVNFPSGTGYPKYKPGTDIDLTASYGIKLNAKGDTPTSGGVIAINKSQDKSIFDTLNEFGLALQQDVTTPQGMTDFTNKMGNILTHVDATMTRLLSVEARMGSGRREADTLVSVGEGFSLQYKTNLSRLQDLDVAKAASELSLTKTALEASQSTFAQVQKLTLFNYI
jgi:flagellar hook-associated protein 3 FlgL